MGAMCATGEARTALMKSRLIDEQMETEDDNSQLQIKLVLLGTGNTGKTTFFRQFQILYAHGIPMAQRHECKELIRQALGECMLKLCEICEEKSGEYDMARNSISNYGKLRQRMRQYEDSAVFEEVLPLVASLWEDPAIRKALENYAHDAKIPDTMEVFYKDMKRIKRQDYVPSDQDCIFLRWPTAGAVAVEFEYEEYKFRIMDVGGQRCERRKWIHVFSNVDAILYVVSLVAYDETLYEDHTVNAMTEQLEVLSNTVNQDMFRGKPLIFFMNKKDLLEDLLEDKPLNTYFDDYDSYIASEEDTSKENDLNTALEFLMKTFTDRVQMVKGRVLYFHQTCAVDTDCVEKVFVDTSHSVLRAKLLENGLT